LSGGESESTFVNPFKDAHESDWFYGDVEYVASLGLMNGTDSGSFSPNMTMSRGMLVTVLGRYCGVDVTQYAETSFSDVDGSQYYAAYIEWAKSEGLVNGVGESKFAPDAAITRQDMAVILMRFAAMTGKDMPEVRASADFADAGNIAGYALSAVETLYRAGIINGRTDGSFDPTATATRAEVAAMLHRFIESIK
jgi:hypothetical protein